MSHTQCKQLMLEYIGQYSAAICKCKDDKECPKRGRTRRKVTGMCFCLKSLRVRPAGFASFGDGEPTAVKPVDQSVVSP